MSPHYRKRYDEIQDGKHEWDLNKDAGGDSDVFHTEYELPLRQLESAGLFEGLVEIRRNLRGKPNALYGLRIDGAINLDFDVLV